MSSSSRAKRKGRPKSSHIHDYYTYDEKTKTNYCLQTNCQKKKVVGDHAGNLAKHLRRWHKKEYEEYLMKKTASFLGEGPEGKKRCIRVYMSPLTLRNAIVGLTTLCGRPIAMVEDDPFQAIVKPLVDAMPEMPSVTTNFVREQITIEFAKIRDDITQQVKAAFLVHVKADIATRHGQSYLGVNIQYAANNKIQLRTLGVRALGERHTAEYLEETLRQILGRFGIAQERVYTITTDNGGNMTKMSRLMRNTQNEAYNNDNPLDSDDDSDTEDENMDVEISVEEDSAAVPSPPTPTDVTQSGVPSRDTSESTSALLENSQDSSDINNSQTDAVEVPIDSPINETDTTLRLSEGLLESVRCGSHTLQLSVTDVLKHHMPRTILKMRNVAKMLRTEAPARALKDAGFRKIVVDNMTRWNSTFDMLMSLLEAKSFIHDPENAHLNLNVTNDDWKIVVECKDALQHAKNASLIFQTEQLTPGDFYGAWITCKLNLEKLNTTIAKALLSRMKIREEKLFDSDAFLAAIFLDPRYHCALFKDPRIQESVRENRVLKAKTILRKLYMRIRELMKHATPEETGSSQSSMSQSSVETQEIGVSDPLASFLNEIEVGTDEPTDVGLAEFDKMLIEFQGIPRLGYKENIFVFWEVKKASFPTLYEIANIVSSQPMTQVSVERLFSGMKFLLSDQRANLSHERVEEIMIVRTNGIFMKKIEDCVAAENEQSVDSVPDDA